MAQNTASNRGFARLDEDERRIIASQGGKASGGQFKSGDERTREAGRRGAAAQPTEAKRRGGENSRKNS